MRFAARGEGGDDPGCAPGAGDRGSHLSRFPRDHRQQHKRRAVRGAVPLLPIAHRAEGEAEAAGELGARDAKRGAERAQLAGEVVGWGERRQGAGRHSGREGNALRYPQQAANPRNSFRARRAGARPPGQAGAARAGFRGCNRFPTGWTPWPTSGVRF